MPTTPWLVGPSGATVPPSGNDGSVPDGVPVGYDATRSGGCPPPVPPPPPYVGDPPLGIPPLSLAVLLDKAALCNGRAMACTAAWIGTSCPPFMEIRSKAIPTIESGDSLL